MGTKVKAQDSLAFWIIAIPAAQSDGYRQRREYYLLTFQQMMLTGDGSGRNVTGNKFMYPKIRSTERQFTASLSYGSCWKTEIFEILQSSGKTFFSSTHSF